LAISFTATAGSVLLLGIGGSLQTTSDILHETVAQGMAQQLMDELLGIPLAGIDDYETRGTQPPTDSSGIELGKEDGEGSTRHANFFAPTDPNSGRIAMFQGWLQEVDIVDVGKADEPSRAIEVRIIKEVAGVPRELARLRRVVAYAKP